MFERFYNLSTIYGIIGAIITIVAILFPDPTILQIATIYDTVGISILIWELTKPFSKIAFNNNKEEIFNSNS